MIDLSCDGGLWTVTINRPGKANSLTLEMLEQLAQIASDAQAARVLVLTGAGKVFSAGADFDAIGNGLARSDVWERLSGAIAALPGLSIAAINGTLAGGAFGMALACDLRIAVTEAKFFYPVMKLGHLPQKSDPSRLAALVGPARAKLILLGGAKLSADEALQIGLIDRLVPRDTLIQATNALARDVLGASPEIATGIKRMCRS